MTNKSQKTNYTSFATKAIRSGQEPDPVTGAVIPAIYQTSTYLQSSPGRPTVYNEKLLDYTRCSNPTRSALEVCLSELEGAKYCVAVGSGLAAITTVFSLLKQGANIVCGNDVYGGVYRLLTTIFEDRYNVKWVDTTNPDNIRNACREFGRVDLLWLEAVSNPLLNISDICIACTIAKEYGAITCIDSTFLTPYLQRPLELGADLVVHSLTKYINGHSDVIAGAILTNSTELNDKLFHIQKTIGPSLSPFDSWLILRGVRTLEIRMNQHQKNAGQVAEFLKNHPKVDRVLYPSLESHKGCDVIKSQTSKHFTGGGIVSFYIKGDATKFLESLKIFQLAESLGGVESLACLPAKMTHASIPEEIRNARGITDKLIRLSVGIEGIDDLICDLDGAFENILQ